MTQRPARNARLPSGIARAGLQRCGQTATSSVPRRCAAAAAAAAAGVATVTADRRGTFPASVRRPHAGLRAPLRPSPAPSTLMKSPVIPKQGHPANAAKGDRLTRQHRGLQRNTHDASVGAAAAQNLARKWQTLRSVNVQAQRATYRRACQSLLKRKQISLKI